MKLCSIVPNGFSRWLAEQTPTRGKRNKGCPGLLPSNVPTGYIRFLIRIQYEEISF